MTTRFETPSALLDACGQSLGHSDWLEIDQARIDQFAQATGDHQWIHVDPERAAQGPFGKTIAHGYLTLSLANLFLPQIIRVENTSMGVNYGLNHLRFVTPVPAGSRIRAHFTLNSVEERKPAQITLIWGVSVEIEGQPKPALVAEWLQLRYLEAKE